MARVVWLRLFPLRSFLLYFSLKQWLAPPAAGVSPHLPRHILFFYFSFKPLFPKFDKNQILCYPLYIKR